MCGLWSHHQAFVGHWHGSMAQTESNHVYNDDAWRCDNYAFYNFSFIRGHLS